MKPPYPTLSEDIRFGHIIGVNPFQQILVKKKEILWQKEILNELKDLSLCHPTRLKFVVL